MLVEQPLIPTDRPLSPEARALIESGRARFGTVHVFDFVPSDYEQVWRLLDALPRGRFCEWGSGFGIVTGLAAMLGFDVCGIEVDGRLAEASRQLLAEFGLAPRIDTGDYHACRCAADVYFVYTWPGRIAAVETLFDETAPPAARLLVGYGQSDIRCKLRELETG
jgi:hypothetical protein